VDPVTNYGTSMSCTDDLHLGREVSGEEAVLEEVYRLFSTSKGTVIDALDWGYNLDDLLGDDLSDDELARIGPGAQAALLSCIEAIRGARVLPTWYPTTGTLRLDVTLALETGTLRLVVSASSGLLTVERLQS
jgi:hypothetical protein